MTANNMTANNMIANNMTSNNMTSNNMTSNNMTSNNSNTPCHYCMNTPNSHSFYLSSTNDVTKIYNYSTKIVDAILYNKPETIIYHINIELTRNNKPNMNYWEWEIDFKDANIKHYLSFNTVYELSKWINAESNGLCSNLKNIKITNSNIMIKPLIVLSKIFLPSHINVKCC